MESISQRDEGKDMAHQLPDDFNALLQLFDQQDGHQRIEALPVEDGESWESEAEGAITETIHVYFVRESELGDPTDEPVVESTLAASDDPLQRAAFADEPQQAHTPADPEMVAHRPVLGTRTRASLARWTVGVGIVLLLTSIALQMVLLLLKPTATITLVPVVRDLSITTNIMAIESGTPTGEQIPARRLTPLTLTQTKTAPATGKGHQAA